MKLFSPEVTIRPCMEHCSRFWADAPSYFLDMLVELQKQVCRTVQAISGDFQ